MLDRVFKRKTKSGETTVNAVKNVPTYEGPIQKRLAILYNERDLVQDIVVNVQACVRSVCDGSYDALATGAMIYAKYTEKSEPELSQTLVTFSSINDGIGRAQLHLKGQIQSKVFGPLEAWLKSDYERIETEIQKMHKLKLQVDKILLKDADTPTAINVKKALDRQTDIVKLELQKVKTFIKNNSDVLENVMVCFDSYFQATCEAFVKFGGDQWKVDNEHAQRCKDQLKEFNAKPTQLSSKELGDFGSDENQSKVDGSRNSIMSPNMAKSEKPSAFKSAKSLMDPKSVTQKSGKKKPANKKSTEEMPPNKKTDEEKLVDKKTEDQKPIEQKTEDQKPADPKNDDQKPGEPKEDKDLYENLSNKEQKK